MVNLPDTGKTAFAEAQHVRQIYFIGRYCHPDTAIAPCAYSHTRCLPGNLYVQLLNSSKMEANMVVIIGMATFVASYEISNRIFHEIQSRKLIDELMANI
jgi:hypothetical protein